MTENEINALISLLDDPDEEIISHVTAKLLAISDEVLPLLEDRYLAESDKPLQEKINSLIEKIHFSKVKGGLNSWAEAGGKDLFEGFFIVSTFRYPELKKDNINAQLDKIKLDAWLELSFQLAPLDKVRILNYVLYDLHGFQGNSDNYHAPDNSFINRVLDTKYGNPISLAIIYSIIAQRLNIPIFGVNLPQHFVLAYKDDTRLKTDSSFKSSPFMDYNLPGEVFFYINAFNKGAVFSKSNVDQFLKQLNLKPADFYYLPCSNVDIILRVLRNLVFAYEKLNDTVRIQGVKELITTLLPFAQIL
jgi:hypothetical protein